MDKCDSDKERFIHLDPMPKDTFLTKLDEDDTSQESSLFPIPIKSIKLFHFCVQLGKFLILCCVIIILVITLWWFHIRLSTLEQKFHDLQLHNQRNEIETIESHAVNSFQENLQTQEGNIVRVKRKVDHERHSQNQHSRSHQGHGAAGSPAHVEFLHPRAREDGRRDQQGSSSSQDETSLGNNSDSVLLTSVSRIPLLAIQDFCSKTKDYCPPGPPGPIGLPGIKGDPGERGDIGDRGPRGPLGLMGIHGLRGPKGESGHPGVEGRDGLPGEPGLDGVNGRNGVDGIPGLEGTYGRDGQSGRDGRNGTDGKVGPPGPKGEAGGRGLTGPTGLMGPGGKDGDPGIPGINATVITGDGTLGSTNLTLLIPPSIIGSATQTRPLVVTEGDNVRLGCTATGTPPPTIEWKREDGYPIQLGNIFSSASVKTVWFLIQLLSPASGLFPLSDSSVNEPLLNFTKVNRLHMGKYICYADNAVTPPAFAAHEVHVNFPPLIHVKTPQSAVVLGKTGSLECEVEGFPRGATSWQTSEGKYITSNDTKYQTSSYDYDLYRVRMVLTVTRTVKSDLTPYFCIFKNAFGIVKGQVTLIEWISSQPTPPPHLVNSTGQTITYGEKKPELEEEYLCPPPPPCPTCSPRINVTKCTSSGYHLIDKLAWEVGVLGNLALPDDNNRTVLGACQLSAVGKPVFHGESIYNGSWMRETFLKAPDSEKYYKTRMEQPNVLLEYANKTTFTSDTVASTHSGIPSHFQGNFHTIYDGSFFYVAANTEVKEPLRIIKYSIAQRKQVAEIVLPLSSGLSTPLYSTRFPESTSKVDLAVDENGLWAIYALPGSTNTIVVKIEVDDQNRAEYQKIVYGWNISIGHKHAGDMFIMCGVLYAVDSVRDRETRIRLGLDLYRKKLLKLDLPFTNPFGSTTLVSYNPRSKELFTLDEGNLLIYPVKQSGLIANT